MTPSEVAMRRSSIALLICISLLAIPAIVWSKGQTISIVIEGDYLTAPIEITDPEILIQFSIWNGPGVGMRDLNEAPDLSAYVEPDGSVGRFIDWPKGFATERPGQLQRLEVTFHVGVPREPGNWRKFVFAYEIDSNNGRGFIYLPQWKNDLIWHGVELNWLYAHSQWNELIMPIVAQHSADPSLSIDERSELKCKVGEGSLRPDGTIEFVLLDESGTKTSHWRYETSTKGYQSIREHIGDVEPGEEIEISCWPARS